jgi:ectoine hydroxylase-related dioxygenase (phytanoyl-CoA dioxygenase family)
MSTTIEQARAEWETQGWSVLEGVFSAEQIATAVATMPELYPTAEEYADGDESDTARKLRQDSHAVMPRFPFEQAPLNELVVHDTMLDLAEAFLETKDFILYQGMASAKYSNGPDDDEQMLHVDYGNHTLVVPRHEPGYQQLEMFIYLTEVTPELAATRMVGRELTTGISVERSYLGPEQYPELYEAEVPAIGPAGSVLLYRPDVYHRGVRMTAPGAARFMLHVSYKPTGTDWLGSQALANACEGLAWHLFIQRATLRQLVALGFPPPGHPYWNAQTLDGVAARYPLLDMSPWRDAFGAGAA